MKSVAAFLRKYYGIAKYAIFPLCLALFPFIKVNKGIDLADTAYSLGNYETFGTTGAVWELLTFLANLTGHIMSLLPFGGTMLGMKIYTSLTISAAALLGYRFFMTKMPAWLDFLAQLAAIGLCWAPSVILYNYLTYLFLLLGAMLIFRGLAGGRNLCLFLAGVVLGLNLFVRFPNNGLEVLLIIALWYYGAIRKKDFKNIVKETLFCIAGYMVSFIILTVIMSVMYKGNAISIMINGALGISGSASDYTLGQMLKSILSAYMHGVKWALYPAICALIGIPFFILFNGKYMRARKIIYCLCIPVLFIVLWRWGMFNFKYYQKESALQWGAIFLLISIGADIWMLVSRQINYDWKLLAAISLIIILITPLGSNNYIWPVLNNLFLIAPITFWTIYKFARWGRSKLDVTQVVPLFSIKAMLSAVVIMLLIQAVGVGVRYVFNDGEDGAPIKYEVSREKGNAERLAGMKTNRLNADNLSQLMEFISDNEDNLKAKMLPVPEKYLLYGNIPGLAYYLDLDSALSTTWADLNSYPTDKFLEELEDAQMAAMFDSLNPSRYYPLIIKSKTICDNPSPDDKKLAALDEFIENNGYRQIFLNDGFVVYYVLSPDEL